jgi:hypothetical protein
VRLAASAFFDASILLVSEEVDAYDEEDEDSPSSSWDSNNGSLYPPHDEGAKEGDDNDDEGSNNGSLYPPHDEEGAKEGDDNDGEGRRSEDDGAAF